MELRSGSKRRYDEVQPRVQRRIVAEYQQGVRGEGYIATAKRLSASCVNGERGALRGRKGRVVIQSHRADTRRESWTVGRR